MTIRNKFKQRMINKGIKRGWYLDMDNETEEIYQVRAAAGTIADMNPIDYCICKTLWWGWGIKYDIRESLQAAWEGLIAVLALIINLLLVAIAPISFPIMAIFKIRRERKWCDKSNPDWRETLKKRADKNRKENEK